MNNTIKMLGDVIITPLQLADSPPGGYNSFPEDVAHSILKVINSNNVV